jgi:hypothetical protein
MSSENPEFSHLGRFTHSLHTGGLYTANTSYIHTLSLGQVFTEGLFAGEWTAEEYSLDGDQEEALKALNYDLSDSLAWVDVFVKARVKIGHPSRLLDYVRKTEQKPEEFDLDTGFEELYGARLKCAPTQYLVNRTSGAVAFMTRDEILTEGRIRPGMAEWLQVILDGKPNFNQDMVEFSKLLK